jgi:hypothetical protein
MFSVKMKARKMNILQFMMIPMNQASTFYLQVKSSDGSSNKTRLDDEGFKSVLMSAKKLCEDIGETFSGQRGVVMGWGKLENKLIYFS